MKEKTDGFGDPAAGRGCERAEDLLAHLYGEAGPAEAAAFGEHLNDCVVCREELAAFRQLRSGVADWHAAVLSAAPSLDLNRALRQEPLPFAQASRATERATRDRSAMAALREFFSLSPLWLRVGTVTAAVAVCALAALTLLRTEITWGADGFAFRTGVPEIMECVAGSCEYKLAGSEEWKRSGAGDRFAVPGDSSFEIRVAEAYHYICHFG